MINFGVSRPVLALKTLGAIDAALEKDQGATYRKHLRALMPQAEDAYRENQDLFRSHLGASIIGKECARELWYSFHWMNLVTHGGRMIRLFNRGHLEEPRFLSLLLTIGCEVWHHDGKGGQLRITGHNGHFGGSLDGVVRGLPEAPLLPMLSEFKTHSDKSFDKLAGSNWDEYLASMVSADQSKEKVRFTGVGVREAKFTHYIQMQTYMGQMKLTRAIYLATNKNNDSIYAELVDFDSTQFEKFFDRGREIIYLSGPPRKISETPGWFTCRFCDFKVQCHYRGLPPVNCRSCVHSEPSAEEGKPGIWRCNRHGTDLTKSDQLAGCPDHKPR